MNITFDQEDEFYWDPSRVKRSALHQFAVYHWAEKLVKEHNIEKIVDIGCGFATKLAWLHGEFPELEFWGVDQPHAVELCKSHYNFGNWLGVDFETNPETPPVKADLIISSDVIEHLENPDSLLDYFRNVVAPGGLILMSTPERRRLRGPDCLNSPNPYHVREWDKDGLANYLKSRNFKIIEHNILPALRFDFSPFYIRKALSRWRKGENMLYNQCVLMQVSEP